MRERLNESDYPDGFPSKVPKYEAADTSRDSALGRELYSQGGDWNQFLANQQRVARTSGPRGHFAVYPGSTIARVNVNGGAFLLDGVHYTVAPRDLSLYMAATNYVYLDGDSRAIGVVTSGFPEGCVALAEIVTDADGMLVDDDLDPVITDKRPAYIWRQGGVRSVAVTGGLHQEGEDPLGIVNDGVLLIEAGSGIAIDHGTGDVTISGAAPGGINMASVWPEYPNAVDTGVSGNEVFAIGEHSGHGAAIFSIDGDAEVEEWGDINYYFHQRIPANFNGWETIAIEIDHYFDWPEIEDLNVYIFKGTSFVYFAGMDEGAWIWGTHQVSAEDLGEWEAGDIMTIRFSLDAWWDGWGSYVSAVGKVQFHPS